MKSRYSFRWHIEMCGKPDGVHFQYRARLEPFTTWAHGDTPEAAMASFKDLIVQDAIELGMLGLVAEVELKECHAFCVREGWWTRSWPTITKMVLREDPK